ncbi:cell division protein FtsQ/DivIB [uncultured Devosia sp.]|uniref:cell division protein FtsQ/DivIB n=1 Tax=uncultured Devosia sp. TaxID=211434 RepID=UPI0035CB10C6
MQQVGSKAILAGAQVIDPRALPARIREPRRRLRNNVGRTWVLHRRRVVRIAAAVMALVAAGVLYQVRTPILDGATALRDVGLGQLGHTSFAIGEISITGQSLASEQSIFDALGVEPHISSVSFDAEAARQRIAELPAVKTVSIRKIYPGDVSVTILEKVPVARWRVDGVTFVVDAEGEQIGEDHGAYGELPLVVGDGAADDALVMIRALEQYPRLQDGLVALSRIADRRWDLIYDTGLRVQLPELGVAQALHRLDGYQSDYQLLDRDVTQIDLRVASIVAVRPTQSEEEDEDK